MGFRLAYLHLTLAHSKNLEIHAHFDKEYRRNVERWDKNYYVKLSKSTNVSLYIFH